MGNYIFVTSKCNVWLLHVNEGTRGSDDFSIKKPQKQEEQCFPMSISSLFFSD